MTFTPLQKLIPKIARKRGVYGAMQAIYICKKANEAINELFKDRNHAEVRAKTFSKGVVKVKVPNSAWAQEITLYRQKIIEHTNEQIGKKAVKSIKTTTAA